MILSFTVHGTPQPQGSTRAFLPKGFTRPIVTSDNPNLKSWRQDVAKVALTAINDLSGEHPNPIFAKGTPVRVQARFFFAQPASVRQDHEWKTTNPDLDKLLRGICDSLKQAGVYYDDSQVANFDGSGKFFGLPERAEISVFPLAELQSRDSGRPRRTRAQRGSAEASARGVLAADPVLFEAPE